MKKIGKIKAAAVFSVLCVLLCGIGALDKSVPNDISAFSYSDISVPSYVKIDAEQTDNGEEKTVNVLGVPFKRVKVNIYKDVRLIPGGEAFGVKLHTRGVMVVGTGSCGKAGKEREPAKEAGIGVNDMILSVDGKEVNSSVDLTNMIAASGGREMRVTCERSGKKYETVLKAEEDDNGIYKAGLWVRDTVAGIGTVTFTETEGGFMGGLGHGICENETGELLPFFKGELYPAHITGVKTGKPGDPGELRGYFGKEAEGKVLSNTEAGVFGILDRTEPKEPVGIALKDDVKEGPASIYCTVNGEGVKEYKAEISRIISYESETKNFIIRITDPRLLAETGGIVQGMSGSPVMQNGKLIGAVTHVLINDPCKGYGIFIENMLDQAENCR
ncbi:MAG: SpoIVB peptidase [Clostridia bacterium]|nr:SpoIVB peptidase [Clostridia bacterium]